MILAQEQAEFDNFLEDFKSFVQMSAKRKLRDITLHNYAQHLRILIRNHGLPIENPDIDDFRRALKSRVSEISAATTNTAIVVARKFAEFRGLDADSREMKKIFQFKRVVPTKRFTREDILTPDDITGILSLMPSMDYKAFFAGLLHGHVDFVIVLDLAAIRTILVEPMRLTQSCRRSARVKKREIYLGRFENSW